MSLSAVAPASFPRRSGSGDGGSANGLSAESIEPLYVDDLTPAVDDASKARVSSSRSQAVRRSIIRSRARWALKTLKP